MNDIRNQEGADGNTIDLTLTLVESSSDGKCVSITRLIVSDRDSDIPPIIKCPSSEWPLSRGCLNLKSVVIKKSMRILHPMNRLF